MIVLSLKCAYGMSVCRCRNASVSSKSARVAVSADYKLGILDCFGKNFTVSHTRVAAVFLRRFSSTCNNVVLVQCTIQVCHSLPICCAYLMVQSLTLLFPVRLMTLYCNRILHWDVPQLADVSFCGSYRVGWLLCMTMGWVYPTGVIESPDQSRPGWR